ncbi:MAG: tetratricopeptide repeat protein [Candidatus Longimicrobiales bacterium M2_2A_002]
MRRALALLVVVLVNTAGVLGGLERGNRLFRAGEYDAAVAEYRAALRDGEDSPVLRYNLGTALLELGRYEEAQQQLEAALEAVDPSLRQYVHYNLGQRFLEDARQSDDPRAGTALYDAAVEAYRQALRLRPDDVDAKWNYELALREREEQMQQQGGGGSGDDQSERPRPPGEEGGSGSGGPAEDPGGQGPPPRPRAGQQPLTPEQAARILSGVEQDERELFRDRLRQGSPQPRTARDW